MLLIGYKPLDELDLVQATQAYGEGSGASVTITVTDTNAGNRQLVLLGIVAEYSNTSQAGTLTIAQNAVTAGAAIALTGATGYLKLPVGQSIFAEGGGNVTLVLSAGAGGVIGTVTLYYKWI